MRVASNCFHFDTLKENYEFYNTAEKALMELKCNNPNCKGEKIQTRKMYDLTIGKNGTRLFVLKSVCCRNFAHCLYDKINELFDNKKELLLKLKPKKKK
jgi:hypothetical protein